VQILLGILANAPPRFALAGLSMGGYIAFVIAQKAPERVALGERHRTRPA
jgi:pimeloyl-ACP methyl ester carboxylesterase